MFKKSASFLLLSLWLGLFSPAIFAPALLAQANHTESETNAQNKRVIRGSGLPVPRFVTVKKNTANMRVGPGHEYPRSWIYVRKNLPLKVISEFDVWRKVVDHQGVSGWIHTSLLSSKRYALIVKSETKLTDKADKDTRLVAIAQAGVMMEIQYCREDACRLSYKKIKGWTNRENIWGILPNEALR